VTAEEALFCDGYLEARAEARPDPLRPQVPEGYFAGLDGIWAARPGRESGFYAELKDLNSEWGGCLLDEAPPRQAVEIGYWTAF